VAYHEAFVDGSKLVIIMEFCKHGDLSSFINKRRSRRNSMTQDGIWMYFIQICRGVQEMHHNQIVHRDIKPANILRSGDGIVKLADLGVAKFLKADLAHTVIGTPYYMPPELWKQKPYDASSDIWALGCILFEMAALKVPFDGRSLQDLQRRICHANPAKLPSDTPEAVRKVIKMCLMKNPKDRPTIDKLLSLPEVKRFEGLVPDASHGSSGRKGVVKPPPTAATAATNESSVIDTIRPPHGWGPMNWKKLNQVLPAANYPMAETYPLPSIAEDGGGIVGAKAASDPTPQVGHPCPPTHALGEGHQRKWKPKKPPPVQVPSAARQTPSSVPSVNPSARPAGRFEAPTPQGGAVATPNLPQIAVYQKYDRPGGRNKERGVKQLDGGAWREEMQGKLNGMEAAVAGVGKRNRPAVQKLPGIQEHRDNRKALVPLHPNHGFNEERFNAPNKVVARVGQGGAGIAKAKH